MLNVHEDVRAKPSSWVVVAWLPVLDEEKSFRPGQGYEGDAARNLRIYHECWRLFLAKFNEDSKNARVVLLGDGKARVSRHSVGAFLGDQQVKYIVHIGCRLTYLTYCAYSGIRQNDL